MGVRVVSLTKEKSHPNNTHPKIITALFREQANVTSAVVAPTLTLQQGVVATPTLTLQEGVVAAPILVGTPVVLQRSFHQKVCEKKNDLACTRTGSGLPGRSGFELGMACFVLSRLALNSKLTITPPATSSCDDTRLDDTTNFCFAACVHGPRASFNGFNARHRRRRH